MTKSVSSLTARWMASWHSQRPTLTMMGEYSSGKSALLNCFLGQALLPTKVTATDLPAIWITAGKEGRLLGLRRDGQLDKLSVKDLMSPRVMEYLVIRLESSAPMLERTDIIDTPGISDPRMSTEVVELIAQYTDAVIWCSPMNQAWRQTERAFWQAMPDRLRETSILALTRSDLMRGTEDVGKVLARCLVETGDLFSAVLPISATSALSALQLPTDSIRSQKLAASGFAALSEQVMKSVAVAEAFCLARTKLQSPSLDEVAAPPVLVLRAAEAVAEPASAAMTDSLPEKRVQKTPRRASDKDVRPGVDKGSASVFTAVKKLSDNEHLLTKIGHLFSQIENDTTLSKQHRDVVALALTIPPGVEHNCPRLLKQIQDEVADFADGPWCDLGGETKPHNSGSADRSQ